MNFPILARPYLLSSTRELCGIRIDQMDQRIGNHICEMRVNPGSVSLFTHAYMHSMYCF